MVEKRDEATGTTFGLAPLLRRISPALCSELRFFYGVDRGVEIHHSKICSVASTVGNLRALFGCLALLDTNISSHKAPNPEPGYTMIPQVCQDSGASSKALELTLSCRTWKWLYLALLDTIY